MTRHDAMAPIGRRPGDRRRRAPVSLPAGGVRTNSPADSPTDNKERAMTPAGRTLTGRPAATGGITAAAVTMAAAMVMAILMAAVLTAGPVVAVEPDEILDDPALEDRARALSRGLRCLVCQNQSIDDSNADLARDLRLLVRERLLAGDTDDAVIDYVTDRYGDYVLLQPPVKPTTYLLWFFPAVLFAAGLVVTARYLRRRRDGAGPAAVSDADSAEARAILVQAGAPDGPVLNGAGPDGPGPDRRNRT